MDSHRADGLPHGGRGALDGRDPAETRPAGPPHDAAGAFLTALFPASFQKRKDIRAIGNYVWCSVTQMHRKRSESVFLIFLFSSVCVCVRMCVCVYTVREQLVIV